MAINFPTSLDSLSNPTSTDTQNTVDHAWQHSNANDAIEALETKVWITNSADTSSLDYKTSRLTVKGDILVHNWTTVDRLPVWTNWYMIVADSTQALWVKYTAPSAWWTVTSASVVTANWLWWTVATATTTPAITLTTSVNGIAKWNGTAFSTATEWVDYYKPAWTDVSVADWGTGVSTLTAYAPIFWGTTWTWAVQSWSVWTAWQILTSNWAWALPTFQNKIFTWVKCTTSASQTIYDNSLDLLNFNSEEFDTDWFHSTSTNNWRITIPTWKWGKYQVMWQYRSATAAAAANNNGFALIIYKNWASTWVAMQKSSQVISGLSEASLQVTWVFDLAAWDYLELYVVQRNVWSNTTTTASWQFFSAYKLD